MPEVGFYERRGMVAHPRRRIVGSPLHSISADARTRCSKVGRWWGKWSGLFASVSCRLSARPLALLAMPPAQVARLSVRLAQKSLVGENVLLRISSQSRRKRLLSEDSPREFSKRFVSECPLLLTLYLLGNMLKFLTHKLKTHSLNEDNPHQKVSFQCKHRSHLFTFLEGHASGGCLHRTLARWRRLTSLTKNHLFPSFLASNVTFLSFS